MTYNMDHSIGVRTQEEQAELVADSIAKGLDLTDWWSIRSAIVLSIMVGARAEAEAMVRASYPDYTGVVAVDDPVYPRVILSPAAPD